MGTGVGHLSQYLCVPLACMRACSVMSDSATGWTSPPGPTVHGIIPARMWSGLLFPTPRELPDTGIESTSPLSPVSPLPPGWQAYQAASLPLWPPGKPTSLGISLDKYNLFFWLQDLSFSTRDPTCAPCGGGTES